ncbi:AMP-binding protein [Terrilactibacillus sp. S3-3]|nr:AMP-binding protein [Terrilactibacillus sp. S3-3]
METGLKKGDVISFQLPNWNEFLIIHLAATRIGTISNPLIPIYRDREIDYMVRLAESKILVIPDTFRSFDYTKMVQRLRPNWPDLEHVFVLSEHVSDGMRAFSDLLNEPWEERRDRTELDRVTLDPNEITEIVFTSGTSGEPKGVMHTHNTLCVSSDYWVDHLQLTENDVAFMASTFAHQTGFLYGARLVLHCGGGDGCFFQDIWNPREFVASIEREKITFTAGATPFLQDTIQLEGLEHYDLRSLRAFIAVGAPIPRVLVRQAGEKLPCRIVSGWGQTEDGVVTLTLLNDSEEKLTETDGRPFHGMRLKVVDSEGRICPPHVEGSLLCKGPALFVGYLKRMHQTLAEFRDGWFMTGDRAVMDEQGYIRISGRDKDIIIRGGENIPVAYVENVLYEHPDILAAQLIAVSDARLQEKACACLIMKQGKEPLTMEAMRAFLEKKGVAKQYWPEHIQIFADFPRTSSGKIKKFRLREILNEKMEDESAAVKFLYLMGINIVAMP